MNSKRTLLATVVLAAAIGSAAAAEPYVGVGLGRSDYRIDTTGATSADTKDSAGKIYGGVSFTPHLGVEASLFTLGEARGTLIIPGIGSTTATSRVKGIAAFGVATLPLGDFGLFGKLGGAYTRSRVEAGGTFGSASASESSFQPAVGLGATYALTRQIGLRAEWERFRTEFSGGSKEDLDLLSLGLTYRF